MLSVGQVLHQRYRIVRPLGHGGMGAVYEAVDERFGGPIALKEIVFGSNSPEQRELVTRAFEREAKSLAKAQHEAIPYVRDYFTELNRQFLVMELIEGDDLAEMLTKRQAPFPLIDCLKWMDQLLDALDYLHTMEPPIIHRDIKPQNLKLNRRGKIKLLDFGIAKSSEVGGPTISNQTFVGATLDYSPIEQILRAIEPTFREYILLRHKDRADIVLNQTTDARCDIYSLGATFYHLLTNHPPPDAVKRTLEIWENRTDPLVDPTNINPAIPPQVSRCVLNAMAIEREGRFISALEMQTALHSATAENKSLASRVYNDSWKDAQALRHGKGDEQQLRDEHLLMQAETVRLDAEAAAALRGKTEANQGVQGFPTEPMIVTPSETSASHGYADPMASPPLVTEPSVIVGKAERKSTAGSISGRGTKVFPESEAAPFAAPAEQVATDTASPDRAKKPARSYRVVYLISALVAVGIAGVMMIGGVFWIAATSGRTSQNSTPNVNSGIPGETPTPFPTPSPEATVDDSSLIVDPTPMPAPTPTPRSTPESTPEPQLTPRRTPAPRSTPVATPRRTPRPRKTQDPNCVYTNTCTS